MTALEDRLRVIEDPIGEHHIIDNPDRDGEWLRGDNWVQVGEMR